MQSCCYSQELCLGTLEESVMSPIWTLTYNNQLALLLVPRLSGTCQAPLLPQTTKDSSVYHAKPSFMERRASGVWSTASKLQHPLPQMSQCDQRPTPHPSRHVPSTSATHFPPRFLSRRSELLEFVSASLGLPHPTVLIVQHSPPPIVPSLWIQECEKPCSLQTMSGFQLCSLSVGLRTGPSGAVISLVNTDQLRTLGSIGNAQ